LNSGHVDLRSAFTAGAHAVTVHDDNTDPATEHDPATVTFFVPPKTEQEIPAGEKYTFMGTGGEPVWVLPESPEDGIVWPGWNVDVAAGLATTGARWTLGEVNGPGLFSLYESVGFGDIRVDLASKDALKTVFEFTEHGHGNWAFTAEGVYCVPLTVDAIPVDTTLTREVTLLFGVGGVDPERVTLEHCGKTPTQIAGSDRPTVIPDLPDFAGLDVGNAGEVRVVTSPLAAGESSYLFVDAALAGKWVHVWFTPGGVSLGWYRVSSTGYVRVTVPEAAAPGDYQLVVTDTADSLIGWTGITLAAPPEPPAPPAPPVVPPGVQIPAGQSGSINACVSGAMVLSEGHIDIGARIINGKVETLLKDNGGNWREPGNTVLWLKPESRLTIPDGYGRVAPVGSSVFQIPQTQDPNLVWLGWSTENLTASQVAGPVWLSLNSVSGPGRVTVYTQNSFGGVQEIVFNNGGNRNVGIGAHSHANWAFTAEGYYRLAFSYTVTHPGGRVTTDQETITIAVGNVDPRAVAGGESCDPIPASRLSNTAATKQAITNLTALAAKTNNNTNNGSGNNTGQTQTENHLLEPVTETGGINPTIPLLALATLLLLASATTGTLNWRKRRETN